MEVDRGTGRGAAPDGNVAGVLATFGLSLYLEGMISTRTAAEAIRRAREG